MEDFRFVLSLMSFMVVLVCKTQSLPIDEAIANAASTSEEFEFFYDGSEGTLKVEYDILLSYDDYNRMYSDDESATRKKRTASLIGPNRYWRNNIVHYEINTTFNNREYAEFNGAIETWERNTCLDFRQSSTAVNRIKVINSTGCYSYVGMKGGVQDISLAPRCKYKPIVLHEIGHALGLFHEQTRPDRHRFVTIIRNNVRPDMMYNFRKIDVGEVDTHDLPYDYMSIMHYGKSAFNRNRLVTIRTIEPEYQDLIGEVTTLSFLDIKTVNKMYNCKRHTRGCTKTDDECPGMGFVGKDCTCWCPGDANNIEDAVPIRPCARPTPRPTPRPTSRATSRPITPLPTPRPSDCQDQHRSCSFWARLGECDSNPSYMHVSCKISCNKCGPGVETVCEDRHRSCVRWRSMGYCNRYPGVVKPRCKRSCGLCRPTTPAPRPVAPVVISPCRDRNVLCGDWASRGECQRNAAFMLTSCRRSCERCTDARPNPEPLVEVVVPGRCRDLNTNCSRWASLGQCTSSPGFMGLMCRASCELTCP